LNASCSADPCTPKEGEVGLTALDKGKPRTCGILCKTTFKTRYNNHNHTWETTTNEMQQNYQKPIGK